MELDEKVTTVTLTFHLPYQGNKLFLYIVRIIAVTVHYEIRLPVLFISLKYWL